MCDSSKKACPFSGLCDKKKSKESKDDPIVSLLRQTKVLKNKAGEGLTPVLDVEGHLKNKVIGLYFSGHWCPPCREFTPVLKKFYEEAGDHDFEIIFLSKDHGKDEYNDYIKEHGDWCALPFEDPLVEKLQNRYEVKNVPTLVIVKHNGEAIVKNAWATIKNASKPPKDLVAQWKQQLE